MAFEFAFNLFHIQFAPQFTLQGSYILVVYATGEDIPEITKVCIHVERESMHRNPTGSADAHRTYFTRFAIIGIQPYSGVPLISPSFYTIFRTCSDNGFFQCAQIQVDIGKKIIQIQNGIPYNLSWAMISDIPTAVNFIKGSVFLLQTYFVQQ